MAADRSFDPLPALASPMLEFSLSECIARSSRERPKRRRGSSLAFCPHAPSPPIELVPNAGLLYVHLNDVIVASAREVLESKRSATVDELLESVMKRQYFDPMTQTFVTPLSVTPEHVLFIMRRDPQVSALVETEGEMIRLKS
jgi:hypothetical protein